MKKSPPKLHYETGILPKTRFVKGNFGEKLERCLA